MRWIIATSAATGWIVSAQRHLFKKYVPEAVTRYVSNFHFDIGQWCDNIALQVEDETDEYIVFGLDDMLPIDYLRANLDTVLLGPNERCGLGWSDARTKKATTVGEWVVYDDDADYQVTTQFSIWKKDALVRVLREVNGTPWEFEVQGRCKAVAFKEPAFRYIEETALSKKWDGKVNVLGLRPRDVEELITLEHIRRDEVYYHGSKMDDKYKEYYDEL